MNYKIVVYFKNGESVEVNAEHIDFSLDTLSFYGKNGRMFAEFSKENVAGWIML